MLDGSCHPSTDLGVMPSGIPYFACDANVNLCCMQTQQRGQWMQIDCPGGCDVGEVVACQLPDICSYIVVCAGAEPKGCRT